MVHAYWAIAEVETHEGTMYECMHSLPFLGEGRSTTGTMSANIEELFAAIAETHALMHELL